jgi:hypothetical protein
MVAAVAAVTVAPFGWAVCGQYPRICVCVCVNVLSQVGYSLSPPPPLADPRFLPSFLTLYWTVSHTTHPPSPPSPPLHPSPPLPHQSHGAVRGSTLSVRRSARLGKSTLGTRKRGQRTTALHSPPAPPPGQYPPTRPLRIGPAPRPSGSAGGEGKGEVDLGYDRGHRTKGGDRYTETTLRPAGKRAMPGAGFPRSTGWRRGRMAWRGWRGREGGCCA